MITASGVQQRLAALEAGADDFVTKPFDQAELLARVASLARIKRYHDTVARQAEELRIGTPSSRPGVPAGRRAGAHEAPTPLPLPAAGRPGARRRGPAAEPPSRDRGRLLRPAQLHAVRRDQRAGGGDGRAARPAPGDRVAGARPRGHPRTVHRRRRDGVLQRPGPLRRRRRARRQDGAGDPGRGPRARPGAGSATGTTSRSGWGSPRATRPWAGSASRAASTTPPSAASRTWRPASAPRRTRGRCGSPTAVLAAIEDLSVAELVGDLRPRVQPRCASTMHDLEDRQVKR